MKTVICELEDGTIGMIQVTDTEANEGNHALEKRRRK